MRNILYIILLVILTACAPFKSTNMYDVCSKVKANELKIEHIYEAFLGELEYKHFAPSSLERKKLVVGVSCGNKIEYMLVFAQNSDPISIYLGINNILTIERKLQKKEYYTATMLKGYNITGLGVSLEEICKAEKSQILRCVDCDDGSILFIAVIFESDLKTYSRKRLSSM